MSLKDLESLLPFQFLDFINPSESNSGDDFLCCFNGESDMALKNWVTARSPESILGGIGSWSFSSNGSSNGELSPPTTPFGAKNDTWDPFYTTDIARLKISNESNKNNNYRDKGLLGPPRIQNLDSAVKNHSFGSCSWQLNQYQQHQARQDHLLKPLCSSVWGKQQVNAAGWQVQPKPHQPQGRQIQSRGRRRAVGHENGNCTRPLGLPQSAWPPLQPIKHNQRPHQSGPGGSTRAVSLNGSGAKRESVGTGVFLPRRHGNDILDHNKKSVLIPARSVDALKDMNLQPQFKTDFATDYGSLMAKRNGLLTKQKGNLHPDQCAVNYEIQLPQEWIY